MEEKKEKLEGLLIALDNLKETMTRAIGELSSRVEDALKETDLQPELGGLAPFDIERAKAGAKVVTTLGEDVRILCYNRKASEYPIVALIKDAESNEEYIESYTTTGRRYDCDEDEEDLRILK